ncbi:hypothetical protein L7F22_023520 [Adiantum nelumboides]|nr:hypothetical protein [Adiantum nelumboides]
MSVSDSMMGYLESAPSLSIAWKSLEKLNEDHTRVPKLQLKTELNTVKQGNMFINDYASKTKTITNSLGSIGVTIDDNDVVATTLEGLGIGHKNFKSSMNTRANVPDFTELTTMLVREEKSLDDLIIVNDSEIEIEHVKGLLKKEFEMKDLGEMRYFLVLEVICTTEGIWLS